jgi:hypothetical protein
MGNDFFMAKRSPQYEALARQFSARLGFDARDLFEELIGTIEQGLVGAARGPHDSDKVAASTLRSGSTSRPCRRY